MTPPSERERLYLAVREIWKERSNILAEEKEVLARIDETDDEDEKARLRQEVRDFRQQRRDLQPVLDERRQALEDYKANR